MKEKLGEGAVSVWNADLTTRRCIQVSCGRTDADSASVHPIHVVSVQMNARLRMPNGLRCACSSHQGHVAEKYGLRCAGAVMVFQRCSRRT